MHSLLEAYLGEVVTHLAGLPAPRRAEELREVRTHLENAVIVGQERGRTEDEAVRDALAQFGTPGALGESLVQAWRREQALNRRSLLGAAACTSAVLILVSYFVLTAFIEPSLSHPLSHTQAAAFEWKYRLSLLIISVAAGLMTAIAFPRRAVAGAILGAAVYSCYCWGRLAFFCATDTRSSYLNTPFFVGQAIQNVEVILATLLVTWAVHRLQMVGQRRRRQRR